MKTTKGMRINQKIRQRVLDIANYILQTKSTVREATKKFRVSKSTVHKDMTERLPIINPELFEVVRKYAKQHNLVISQESSYDKGKIVIFIFF